MPSSVSPGRPLVASSEKSKSAEGIPRDLLPVIRVSGVLSDRQIAEIKQRF